MDYSRPRVRLGASSSTILGGSNGSGGGPQMVKTYGRFRQRIAHRDAKIAEDFARVTSVRPILADLLDSSSSDSDFVEKAPQISTPKSRKSSSAASRAITPAKALLNSVPAFSKPALIATPHEVKSGSREVINSDTSDTENIAPATAPTPKPKSKAKVKAKANETPKTKPRAVSKPITKSKLKPRITPKVKPRKKVEVPADEKAATTGKCVLIPKQPLS
ncbi:hypothetical protein BX661DRAFT_25699 [Kickxella alabastrina]|uniref:uncharacterized protein n=1 Tax=Kickxella alabastrina TaxID=61397 RepID=UPI0022204CF3|nr:uncharacterized protein BX661DRAFT_25699 [Kickxella alabastrina]KAI7827321.1 hypothetical protein BX661DRAFT_25699 [Kickxella alabastrina]